MNTMNEHHFQNILYVAEKWLNFGLDGHIEVFVLGYAQF